MAKKTKAPRMTVLLYLKSFPTPWPNCALARSSTKGFEHVLILLIAYWVKSGGEEGDGQSGETGVDGASFNDEDWSIYSYSARN